MNRTSAVSFDADRMRRYDREGPRYTSYPTAQQFADGIAPNVYERAAAGSCGAREGHPLSAYVHIPFCFSPCFYFGCNKNITPKFDRIRADVGQFNFQSSACRRLFDTTRVVDQLHFGGGTPTY